MEAIKSPLARMLDKCGTSRRQIGLLTGISRSHLSELESGTKDLAKLACGQMLALCAELSTTPEYLLYELGAEDMDERSRLEQEMLSVFRRASEEDQRKIIGSARGIVGDNLLGNEEAA